MLALSAEGKLVPSQPPVEPATVAQPLKTAPLYLTPLEDMVFRAFQVAVVSMKALGLSPAHHEQVVQDFALQLARVPFNDHDMEREYDKLERCIREVARHAYVPDNSHTKFDHD